MVMVMAMEILLQMQGWHKSHSHQQHSQQQRQQQHDGQKSLRIRGQCTAWRSWAMPRRCCTARWVRHATHCRSCAQACTPAARSRSAAADASSSSSRRACPPPRAAHRLSSSLSHRAQAPLQTPLRPRLLPTSLLPPHTRVCSPSLSSSLQHASHPSHRALPTLLRASHRFSTPSTTPASPSLTRRPSTASRRSSSGSTTISPGRHLGLPILHLHPFSLLFPFHQG